jgi:hypothetical protein
MRFALDPMITISGVTLSEPEQRVLVLIHEARVFGLDPYAFQSARDSTLRSAAASLVVKRKLLHALYDEADGVTRYVIRSERCKWVAELLFDAYGFLPGQAFRRLLPSFVVQ